MDEHLFHKVEVCDCQNVLFVCGEECEEEKHRVNIRVCRCEEPGPGRGMKKNKLSTTNKVSVKIGWDEYENREIASEKENRQRLQQRHKDRQRRLGGRVVYDL